MSRPTDHPSGHGASSDSDAKRFKLREGTVTKPGFREVSPDEVGYSKGHHPKRHANPQDRKNIFYGILAIVIALVILSLLELKQLRDAAEEKALQTNTTEQSTNAPEQGK